MVAASIARGATTKGAKKTSPSESSHPTYFQMIKDAILALREKSGSSPHAIAKCMEEHHKTNLPSNFKKILGQQLKNSVAKGKLIKVKASFKLSDAAKKEKSVKPASEKKPKAPKAAEKKTKPVEKAGPVKKKKASTVKPVKKGTVKKAPAKKTPVKLKALKSIKTPALKKGKKA